jgi:hypothetical protein
VLPSGKASGTVQPTASRLAVMDVNEVFKGTIGHDGHMPKGLRLYLPS